MNAGTWSEELRSVVDARARHRGDDSPSLLFGVEDEYRVLDHSTGSQLDFRSLVHGLGLGRRHLDPDDPFAYRLPTGNVVTCDEAEAEIVLAPIRVAPNAAAIAVGRVVAERASLAARIPAGLDLLGHSTHISVSCPDDRVEALGWDFARRFAASLARIVASPIGCGVWVRPRPDRLELCLDFVDGDRLGRAIEFATGAVAALLADAEGMPPALAIDPTLPQRRNGWSIGRRAFGGDALGELDAPLGLAVGGSMPAGAHHRMAVDVADAGRRGLPEPAAQVDGDAAPFGDAIRARTRARFEMAPVALTWRFGVFLLLEQRRLWPLARRAFVVVPRERLAAFLEAIDDGSLDAVVRGYLHASDGDRTLATLEQTGTIGIFDTLAMRRGLLPTEHSQRPARDAIGVAA